MVVLLSFIIVLAVVGVISVAGCVKAPPNRALIITGFSKKPRKVIGRVSWRIPFFERVDKIRLSAFSVDVGTDVPIPTSDFINVNVNAVVKLQVNVDDEKAFERACRNFINKEKDELKKGLQGSIQGNLREIIGTLPFVTICTSREELAAAVQRNASEDMDRLGLIIVSCNVMNVSVEDENVLINLGEEQQSKIRLEAERAKAEADKEIEISKATAEEEANREVIQKRKHIIEQNAELDIMEAELNEKAAIAKARADNAYSVEDYSRKVEVDKILEETDNMIAKYRLERKKLEAEGEKYTAQTKTDSEVYNRVQSATIAVPAEAEAEKIKGQSAADVIMQKAEAMKQVGEFEAAERLLESFKTIVGAAASPLEKTEKIVMYGKGSAPSLVQDVMNTANQVAEGIKEGTGLNVPALAEKIISKYE